ncbi:hypothetical protein [Arsenicibacter rosenii]|nr:hypothetical protein [Arsenicibacter rosenii]
MEIDCRPGQTPNGKSQAMILLNALFNYRDQLLAAIENKLTFCANPDDDTDEKPSVFLKAIEQLNPLKESLHEHEGIGEKLAELSWINAQINFVTDQMYWELKAALEKKGGQD